MIRDALESLLVVVALLVALNEPAPPMPAAGGCPDERACIALAVYAEARGERLDGQVAVAEAVLARGGQACDVVAAPGQFEGVERMPVPREPWIADPKAWGAALAAARIAQERLAETPCRGSTHFFAHSITTPSWAVQGRTRSCVIGGHTFIAMTE